MSQPIRPAASPPPSIPVIPYATPRGLVPLPGGAWRDGATLVFSKQGQLPNACVKCGQTPEKVLTRKLTWYPPLAYLGLLAGVLPFAIVALILQKKATVMMPMCAQHLQSRKRSLLIAWGLGLGGLAMAILLPIYTDQPVLMVIGIIACLGGIIFGVITASPLKPKKIDDQYAYLKGAGAAFLNQLPDVNATVPLQYATPPQFQ